MKYKEIYLLIFSLIFLFLTNFLNKTIRTTNYVDPFQDIDSKAYIYNAEKFYKHNTVILKEKDKNEPYFALGYSAFIAIIYKIFRPENNYVIWVQVFLSLITCFLIFYTTTLIFGSNVGVIAFILSCLNVGFITFSQFILAETLLTFFLTCFLYLFTLFNYKRKLIYIILAALFLGISIFIKPAAIYFSLLAIFLITFLRNGKRLKAIILFALFFYLPVISYMTFNKINFGYFSVATLGNESLYLYLFPKVLAIKNNTNSEIERKKLDKMITGSKLNPNSWNRVKVYFVDTLKKNSFLFVKVWLKNVAKSFLGLYTTNLKILLDSDVKGSDLSFFKQKGKFLKRVFNYINSGTKYFSVRCIGIYETLWSLLRYFLVILGLIFLIMKRDCKSFCFLFFYILYFSMITGHDGCARFRMMFEPALIILAAQGFFVIYYRLRYRSCPFGEL